MASPEFYNSYENLWQQIDGRIFRHPASFFNSLHTSKDLDLENVQSVLSIGPGRVDADIITKCLPKLRMYEAVDRYAGVLERVKAYFTAHNINLQSVSFIHSLMEDYSGEPNQWEVVLLSNVLYHVTPPLSNQLSRMYELVKPGGKMVIIVEDGHVTDTFNFHKYLEQKYSGAIFNSRPEMLERAFQDMKLSYSVLKDSRIVDLAGEEASNLLLHLFLRRRVTEKEGKSFKETMRPFFNPGTESFVTTQSIFIIRKPSM